MMKIKKNLKKRGVSEMVAYVMLIVIAVSLSLVVYSWLKIYVIKPQEECNDEAGMVIEGYECMPGMRLNLTIKNHGNFILDGFMIKASKSEGKPAVYPLYEVGKKAFGGQIFFKQGLNISEKRGFIFDFSEISSIIKIEIEPFMIKDNKIILCENAVISEDVTCN